MEPDGHGQHLPQNCRGGGVDREEMLEEQQDEPADIGVTPSATNPPSQPQICIGAILCSEDGKCRARSADVGRDLGKASRVRPPPAAKKPLPAAPRQRSLPSGWGIPGSGGAVTPGGLGTAPTLTPPLHSCASPGCQRPAAAPEEPQRTPVSQLCSHPPILRFSRLPAPRCSSRGATKDSRGATKDPREPQRTTVSHLCSHPPILRFLPAASAPLQLPRSHKAPP
ncbi:interleukin-18 isoform X1 [Corvus hawaiiensis]|uniref:interleukin-18 isoform X1 n=1 Tax=Corvus hawaiiensis TaxID=134902 RepID=UPI002019FE47|nr:interleukin-18 isoform X1 [Corvus hawaiiensis]